MSGVVTLNMKLLCIHMHQINYTINVLTCNVSLPLSLSHTLSLTLPPCLARCQLMQIYLARSLLHLHVAILISFCSGTRK